MLCCVQREETRGLQHLGGMPYQISRFSGNLHWSYGSRKEGEEVYAQFEAMESAKRLGYPHPDGTDGRELRHVRQFAIKDVILCVLVIVVLIQSYLLYKE